MRKKKDPTSRLTRSRGTRPDYDTATEIRVGESVKNCAGRPISGMAGDVGRVEHAINQFRGL
jgi:hypothetical protein